MIDVGWGALGCSTIGDLLQADARSRITEGIDADSVAGLF